MKPLCLCLCEVEIFLGRSSNKVIMSTFANENFQQIILFHFGCCRCYHPLPLHSFVSILEIAMWIGYIWVNLSRFKSPWLYCITYTLFLCAPWIEIYLLVCESLSKIPTKKKIKNSSDSHGKSFNSVSCFWIYISNDTCVMSMGSVAVAQLKLKQSNQ